MIYISYDLSVFLIRIKNINNYTLWNEINGLFPELKPFLRYSDELMSLLLFEACFYLKCYLHNDGYFALADVVVYVVTGIVEPTETVSDL